MKHPDFDQAFAPTPEIVSLSIEAAFRKGEKAMKFRHKLITALSAAAVLLVACAAAVFALPNEPRPDVVSQPVLTEPTEEPTVYYTSKGIYYHHIVDCSGMMNAQPHPLSEAQSDGKLACPVCVQGEIDTNWSFDEAEPEPTLETETYDGSISMEADETVVELESHSMSTITPWVTAAPTPGPKEFDAEGQIVYHTEKGKYYHLNMHCSGMMNASAHSITDAENAGKLPCPVCITELTAYSTVDPSLPDTERPFYDTDAVPDTVEETPAKLASDIFTNVFGVYLFDAFEDYEYVSANAYGVHSTDGLLTEEIEFCFAQDGWQFAPVEVTVESMDDKIQSGSIRLAPEEGFRFDWRGFYESSSPWYQNVCDQVATLEGKHLITSAGEQLSEGISQVYVYFDSELKPSVFAVDYQYSTGYFNMGFDILDDGQAEFTNMSYNKTKA